MTGSLSEREQRAREQFCARIGYQFKDPELLTEALTHRSAASRNNERLEFLGDSIVNLVIAEALFIRCPDYPEGDLSRMRASLVRGESLAEIAQEFDYSSVLILGEGELRSGGKRRASIQADAVESIIGAIYRDSDFETVRERILSWYQERLDNLPNPEELKDPKTRLQEWLQSRGLKLPTYKVTGERGKDHEKRFFVTCTAPGLDSPVEGVGTSRRKAEQASASQAFELLRNR